LRSYAKANCAGADCDERGECRRFQVRIGYDVRWLERGTGEWINADVEKRRLSGACPAFLRWVR